jgi:hypothetical protein
MTWALVTPVRNIYANFIEDAKATYLKNSTNGTAFVVDSIWWFRRRIGSAITTDFALGISRRSPSENSHCDHVVAFPATIHNFTGRSTMKSAGTLPRTLAVVLFLLAVLLFASLASAQQSQLQAYTAVSPATDAGGKPIGPAQAAANSNLATFNYTVRQHLFGGHGGTGSIWSQFHHNDR